MTVQPGRHLTGLTFDQVEAEVKREHELVEKAEEFESNLDRIRIYRTKNQQIMDYSCREFLDLPWTREAYRAEDWVFHDTTTPEPTAVELKALKDNEKREFTRDDIMTAVSMELGRFYYSNADTHTLPAKIIARLGFR